MTQKQGKYEGFRQADPIPVNPMVSSFQLASKLRKIKQNLDNSNYLNDNLLSKAPAPTANTTGSLKHPNGFSIFSMVSPALSTSNSVSSDSRHYTRNKSSSQQQLNQSPISCINRQLNSRLTMTPDSMSQVLNINRKQFEFELNTNNSSLDFILDQIKPSLNDKAKKLAAPLVVNELYGSTNNIPKLLAGSPSKITNDKTNLVSLNQTFYTDNVSRQSSIRSLISNGDACNTHMNKSFQLTNGGFNGKFASNSTLSNRFENSALNSNMSREAVVPSPDTTKPRNNLYKYKKVRSKASVQLEPVLSKNEIDLLTDWDAFKADENAAYTIKSSSASSSATLSSSLAEVESPSRPDTRLGFQTHERDSSPPESSQEGNYFDNITVRSSNSSNKFYQDVSEDCESVPLTPTNKQLNCLSNFRAAQLNDAFYAADKRPDSTQSVLSNFISNLKFEDNFQANKFQGDSLGNEIMLFSSIFCLKSSPKRFLTIYF